MTAQQTALHFQPAARPAAAKPPPPQQNRTCGPPSTQLERVRFIMKDKRWHTLGRIAGLCKLFFDKAGRPVSDSEAAISARLRDLKAEGYMHERRRKNGRGNTWEYRLTERTTQ